MHLEQIWPPFSLRIRTSDMELSAVREADYPELAEIARGGVRVHDTPAFLVNWDSGAPEQIARSIAQYQWGTRANFRTAEWTMEFTVRVDGRAVGVQGVSATDFLLTKTIDTGSWLARHEQGRGFGTMMRAAVVTAFADHFDAVAFRTGYFEGNDASRRVSEKVGYTKNGIRTAVAQDGAARTEHQMLLQAADLDRDMVSDLQVDGAEAVRRFLELPER